MKKQVWSLQNYSSPENGDWRRKQNASQLEKKNSLACKSGNGELNPSRTEEQQKKKKKNVLGSKRVGFEMDL